jgi:S-methyl-5-thioribulose 1-phosphate isomerase
MIPNTSIALSGHRFRVTYTLLGNRDEIQKRAEHICVEQTIEFPPELIGDDDIRHHILGQIEAVEANTADSWDVVISYAIESSAMNLPQTLNVIFGNISLEPGVVVKKLDLPDAFSAIFKGPRFGIAGLRALCAEPDHPLFCSALKPMGRSAKQLAEYAGKFALGGIHFIKDDHGISDQPFSPFRERVKYCVDAVEKANAQTGLSCKYVPTINSSANTLHEDARWAKEQGVGGLMLLPGISGFDAMRAIADDDDIALPILGHPAWLGSHVSSPESGISPYALFGQIMRMAGADVTIYPNFGGRFSFSREVCMSIAEAAKGDMGQLKPIFPSPGGGMNFSNIPEMVRSYGNDIMFLIGGALHKSGPDLVENCRQLRTLVSEELKTLG